MPRDMPLRRAATKIDHDRSQHQRADNPVDHFSSDEEQPDGEGSHGEKLRYDDPSRVTSQSKGRSERDELRMPDGEERIPMDAAGSGKDRIRRDTRQAFVVQMLVGRATAERAWIRSAGIAILCLDEHQRHRRAASACTHEAEFAPVVKSTPRIPDARRPASSRLSNVVDSRSIVALVASWVLAATKR